MRSENVRDDQLPAGTGARTPDAPVTPAASVILCRGRAHFEVLLMRRPPKSSFVPDAWVFPGGIVEEVDRSGGVTEEAAFKRCAIRELFEEAGVWLGAPLAEAKKTRAAIHASASAFAEVSARANPDALVLAARWITPVGVPRRFDTAFFAAEAPEGAEATADEKEALELRWMTPGAALDAHAANRLPLVFPTIKNLEALLPWETPADLLAARRASPPAITRPVLVVEGGQKKILLPAGPARP